MFHHVFSPFFLLFTLTFCIQFIVIRSQVVRPSQRARRPIKRFLPYGRRCFKVTPCIMFASHEGAFGCAQCKKDVIRAPVVEFVSREELNTFINGALERVVMIPEFLFFEVSVLPVLQSASRINALVVYSGDSPNNLPTPTTNVQNSSTSITVPAVQQLPYPPVSHLSVDSPEPNIGYNYYPTFKVDDKTIPPDYSSDEDIVDNIKAKAADNDTINVRNGFGTGLKFRFFPYNIFHISAETAAEIRDLSRRFSDTNEVGAQPGLNSDRTPISPEYKLESIGRMYACASEKKDPDSGGGSNTSSPTPSPTPVVSPEFGTSDNEDNEPLDSADTARFGSTPPFETEQTEGNQQRLTTRQDDQDETPGPSTTDSEKCLKEQTCLPIGGQSLWSALGRLKPRHDNKGDLFPTSKLSATNATNSNILAITAPMDSMAFFPNLAYGASAEITSLAVLLAISEAVGSYWRTVMEETDQFLQQPIYFAWNAQSWGWAGSSRFLKDLAEFKCENASSSKPGCEKPFMASLKFFDVRNLDKLNVINIGQLISPNALDNFELPEELRIRYYLNSIARPEGGRRNCNSSDLQREFNDIHSRNPSEFKLIDRSSDQTLYPLDASHSFKRYYPKYNNCSFDIISINNFETNFSNRYYHSIFDNKNLTTGEIEDGSGTTRYRRPMYAVAELIAKVVAKLAFGQRQELNDIEVKTETIDGVITCMTSNWTLCPLKEKFLPNLTTPPLEDISEGNYAGSFFPSTRLDDSTPSWAVKLALIRNMFAFFNRYDMSSEEEQPPDPTPQPEGTVEPNETGESEPKAECRSVKECNKFIETVNSNVSSQTEWHTVFCTKGKCVLSDTYMHDAFGTAIKPDNDIRSKFNVTPDHNESIEPAGGAWTESVWDEDLGLCGYVEDTKVYGGVVLGTGIVLTIMFFFTFFFIDRKLFSEIAVVDTEETPLTREVVPP